jgi:hypothetical protein
VLGRPFHRRQLLSQRHVLEDQFPMSAEGQRQRAGDHDEQLQHASMVGGVDAKINADEFWRGSGREMNEDTLTSRARFGDNESRALTHDVLFMDDLARLLRTSRSTIERRRRAGTFPIPELPSIDERPRWSRQAVERYLGSSNGGIRPRRGSRTLRRMN